VQRARYLGTDPITLWYAPEFFYDLAGWAQDLEAELHSNPPNPADQLAVAPIILKPGDPHPYG